ncbi:hypothetical protein JCM10213_008239 [Rhodosporidiobolus nylandii]
MEGQADDTLDVTSALEDQSVNPVPSTSAEADAFGPGIPPELFPDGAPGTVEGGENPVPGQAEGDRVKHALEAMPVEQRTEQGGFDATLPDPPAGMVEDDGEDMAGDDLFGDDDDDEPMQEAQPAAAPSPSPEAQPQHDYEEGLTAEQAAARRRLEYDEDERSDAGSDTMGQQQTIEQEQRFAQVPFANYAVPPGGKVWHTKLPGFLQINVSPYDQDQWQPEADEQEEDAPESQGPDGKKPKHRVPDDHVIRWRWTKDELGEVVKQSNARIVRWSDGTLSLQLGTELFDLSLSLDHSAVLTGVASALPVPPALNPSLSLVPSAFDAGRQHSLTYLTARHPYNVNLGEAQASIYGTIGMRPASLQGKTHKKLAAAVRSRDTAGKQRATKFVDVQEDPEKARMKREKDEADKAKKAAKEARKAAGGGKRGGGRRAKKATTIEGLDVDSDEDDGSDGGYGRRSQPKRRGYGRDSDDDDGFVAKSDDDMAMSDASPEELEEAEEELERSSRRRKERKKQRDVSTSPEAEETAAAPRRRLVVESDEE